MNKLLPLVLLLTACGGAQPSPEPIEPTPAPEPAKPFVVDDPAPTSNEMTVQKLGELIQKMGTNIEGTEGFWKFEFNGRMIAVVTDASANRMRIVTPIAKKEELEPAVWEVLLEANFHTALDARYATSQGILYSVYLHPLSSLTAKDFELGAIQVVNLAKSFGTSFSSGGMQFN